MTYKQFRTMVCDAIKSASGGIGVKFHNDEDRGRYVAKCSDGTMITGNSTTFGLSVRDWNGRWYHT